MKRLHTALLGLTGVAGAVVAAAATPLLLPITDADMASMPRSHCRTWFATPPGDRYALLSANGLVVRTGAARSGLRRCPLSAAQFDDFGARNGAASCGGARLTLTRTGEETAPSPGRAASAQATLTVERGGRRTVLTGLAETECGGGSDEP